jgi:serine/threonine protein phosphatase PrpC
MIPLRTEWQALTDVGRVREANEDRYCVLADRGLWAVADGMGGMARGDWAAGAVADTLAALPPAGDWDALLAVTSHAIHEANARILAEARARGAQMGSTVVALLMQERRFAVFWAGDSRAYLLRGGKLHQLTRDHSQVQELIDRGVLDAEGAARHPLRSVLTRAVGVVEPLALDMIVDTVQPDDLFLLCSDGLHGVIGEAEIAALMAGSDHETAARAMIDRCLERGAPDNVTLILVVATEPTLLHFGAIGSGAAS